MSPLLTIRSLSKSFGSKKLFQNIFFSIFPGDRVGLIGPNGAGKSSLLKILMGLDTPDGGEIAKGRGITVAYASQLPDFDSETVENILVGDSDSLERRVRARMLLDKAQFADFSQDASKLSGGWKKRLDILRALMAEPDLLLLDEPTNHLDLEGILWLEKFLAKERCAQLIVSHDRRLLSTATNKTMELNPCYPEGLFICSGNLEVFWERKEAFIQGALEQERALKGVLRTELEWLRRSPKARTTKSTARVKQVHHLMNELSDLKRRNKKESAEIAFAASERQTRKLLVAKNIGKSLGQKELFKGVEITLSPGVRLGLVGKNGTGKTTLLKILSGELEADRGTIKYADDLKLVYFDQHREQIPLDMTLKEALCPSGEMVNVRGTLVHVNGWAKRFLFDPASLNMPVGALSGGERARILIAKLMCQSADILFLDEPTNDLDIDTLEVMEESLREFGGAVVLISHDRFLMESICTQILGLGSGNCEIYADYRQWEQSQQSGVKKEVEKVTLPLKKETSKRLSYLEKQELQGMEETITAQEAQVVLLQKRAEEENSLEVYRALGLAQTRLEELFERWQELLNRG